ncbi:hypothetical protein HDV64DRAFT_258584 [Trichoderma sp. TUCIM 5745]
MGCKSSANASTLVEKGEGPLDKDSRLFCSLPVSSRSVSRGNEQRWPFGVPWEAFA